MFFIDPYPSDAELQHQRVVDFAYETLRVSDAETHQAAEAELTNLYFPLISKYLSGGARLLDVGCGTGTLMARAARDLQMACAGVELNRDRAAIARKGGFKVSEIPIEHLQTADKFDRITLINVLSHIPNLRQLFLSLTSILEPGGVIILKVGEMAPEVRKTAILDWGIPDHLHFLGLDTIEHLCGLLELELVAHDRTPLSNELFGARWAAPGRSAGRNQIKRTIAAIPGALPLLQRTYDLYHGRNTVFSSVIVVRPSCRH